jgi:(R)-2-hydroxyacyl-CoA dehydratese activating ATPase
MLKAGIDAGSRTIKAVIWDTDAETLLAHGILDQGIEQEALANQLLTRLLQENGLTRTDLHQVAATGYGRNLLTTADTTITEITCHARGVFHLAPEARTVIDIGGQDSKLIRLNNKGGVRDFVMNDRCAAGTGRFLEVVAERLGVETSALGALAAKSQTPATVSSMCVVFAETEIVGLLASGASREDIVAGVQKSIAQRLASMAGRMVEEPVYFTGGVALVPGMTAALENALQKKVHTAPYPQFTGALGGALMA